MSRNKRNLILEHDDGLVVITIESRVKYLSDGVYELLNKKFKNAGGDGEPSDDLGFLKRMFGLK